MAASNQAHYLYGSLKGKTHYQRDHSAQYSGFKLATRMFVLYIYEFIVISHFPQALRLYLSGVGKD